MKQEIWLVRHGNRIDFVDETWREEFGDDPYLSDDGVLQAQQTGRRLRREGIQHLVASPFLRTLETADHIAAALKLPIYLEPGVGEWLNDEWFETAPKIMTPKEAVAKFPRVDLSHRTIVRPQFPESELQALARCRKAVLALAKRYPGNLLIVCHGFSQIGMSWALMEDRCEIDWGFCSLVKIVREDGKNTLALAGDRSHLTAFDEDENAFDGELEREDEEDENAGAATADAGPKIRWYGEDGETGEDDDDDSDPMQFPGVPRLF